MCIWGVVCKVFRCTSVSMICSTYVRSQNKVLRTDCDKRDDVCAASNNKGVKMVFFFGGGGNNGSTVLNIRCRKVNTSRERLTQLCAFPPEWVQFVDDRHRPVMLSKSMLFMVKKVAKQRGPYETVGRCISEKTGQ